MASEDTTPDLPNTTSRFIAAVDIGTSGTSVAFECIKTDQSKSSERVTPKTITEWPGNASSFGGEPAVKVPTEVSYDNGHVTCGTEIPPGNERYKWFKMAFDIDAVRESEFGKKHPQYVATKAMSKAKAQELATHFFKWLRQHIDDTLCKHYSKPVVDSTPISFIFTVPAVWGDGARSLTIECAKEAGFGEEVALVTEPEAAVVHSLFVLMPDDLKVGDKFVVVDAGGGSVDLISYIIREAGASIKMDEVVGGDGKWAGGTFVDDEFCAFMSKRFGAVPRWSKKKLAKARAYFEKTTKVSFQGNEKDGVMIPLPGIDDSDDLDIVDGEALIGLDDIKAIFQPVITEILGLIDRQLLQIGTKPRSILLVGGFGQSKYLFNCVKAHVGDEIEVLKPVDGRSAVAQGATREAVAAYDSTLSKIVMGSRIARKTYGLQIKTLHIPGTHVSGKELWDPFHGQYRIKVMKPVVGKGRKVSEKSSVSFPLHSRQLVSMGPFSTDTITIYAHDEAVRTDKPSYRIQGWKALAKMQVDLASISAAEYATKRGHDGNDYYVIDYVIKATYFSAHTEYRMFFKDETVARLTAEYV